MANVDAATANIRLNGKQFKHLWDAILDAYNRDTLKQALRFQMSEDLDQIVKNASLRAQVFDLVDWAELQGRTRELAEALRRDNSSNTELKGAVDSIFPSQDRSRDDLEKIVVANPMLFNNPEEWRQEMIRAERTVCRIERPEGRAWGTGFLVAPTLLMTNHHVKDVSYGNFESKPSSVRFRFGFRELDNGQAEGGSLYSLSKDWLVHESGTGQLDYVVVRLDGTPAADPIGNFQNAPNRGWLKPSDGAIQVGQALFILQHPQGDTLKMANGGLKALNRPWLEYEVNTEPGSSGSPVFNNKWELIALHSRYGQASVNKGIAMSAILDALPQSVRNELLINGY